MNYMLPEDFAAEHERIVQSIYQEGERVDNLLVRYGPSAIVVVLALVAMGVW